MVRIASFRRHLPALAEVGAVHLGAVWLLLHAIVIAPPPHAVSETQISLPPLPVPVLPRKHRPRTAATPGGLAAMPYFNPYTYQSSTALQTSPDGLALALAQCDTGKYDMASDKVRAMCDRIGALIKSDPGHFGLVSDVKDSPHWQRELARREAPYLAPCMSPGGPDVFYALSCIYKVLFGGYDSESRLRYAN